MLLIDGRIKDKAVFIGDKNQRKMGEMKDEYEYKMCRDEEYVYGMCKMEAILLELNGSGWFLAMEIEDREYEGRWLNVEVNECINWLLKMCPKKYGSIFLIQWENGN